MKTKKDIEWLRSKIVDYFTIEGNGFNVEGYEILDLINQLGEPEEEQKYYILDFNDIPLLEKVGNQIQGTTTELSIHEKGRDNNRFKLTEQEIKGHDKRYWPFAEPVEKENEKMNDVTREQAILISEQSDKLEDIERQIHEWIRGGNQTTALDNIANILNIESEDK